MNLVLPIDVEIPVFFVLVLEDILPLTTFSM